MSPVQKTFRLGQLLTQFALQRPRDAQHVLGMALDAAERIADSEADVRSLPALEVETLGGSDDARVQTQVFAGVPASISLLEAYALGLLLHRLKAKRLFEFGTYKGVSTTQLALNLPPDGKVFTLDLPDEEAPTYTLAITKESERDIARQRGKGALIPADLLPKVEFLRLDSAKFDPSPFVGSMDLVFVDGAHSADYVRNDSEKGWAMLRPGGVLVWHDCLPNHPDVVRYVRNCALSAARIQGTSLACATKPAV